MNWTTILSGTTWSHAAGFSIATIALVSFAAVMASRLLPNRAVVRHCLLSSALCACLTVPFIGLASGYLKSPILSIPVPLQPSNVPPRSVTVAVTGGEAESAPRSESAAPSGPPVVYDPNIVQPKTPVHRQADARRSALTLPSIGSIVTTLWSAGTFVLALSSLQSFRRGRSIRRRSSVVDSTRISRCRRAAQQRVGLGWLPAIMRSDEVCAPVVHGFRDPVVILPENLDDSISDEDLTRVLVHEFAHVHRRDTTVLVAEVVARALLWPIATVHWMLRDLRRAREEICDNFVLAGCDPIQYAKTLVKIAEFANGRRDSLQAVSILQWQGQFERRIAGLLDANRSRSRMLSPSLSVMLGLLVVVVSASVNGSRLVATEAAPRTGPGQAEQPEAENDNLARHTARVVDWQGHPVAGAKVELWLLGFSAPGAGGGNRPARDDAYAGTSDAEGRIVVPYPKLGGPGGVPTTTLYLSVAHPEHPRWSKPRKVSSEDDIRLSRPLVLSISATLRPSGSPVVADLYAVTHERETEWRMTGGRLISGPVDRDSQQLVVVHAPENGPASFSDVIDLSNLPIVEDRIEIDAVLDPSVELRGRLGDNLPLPIRGGRVVAMSLPSAGSAWPTWWSTTASISEDGVFVLKNLPPRRHVQLIALCEGGVSRSPRPSEVRTYCRQHGWEIEAFNGVTPGKTSPLLYFVDDRPLDVVVPIDPTGDVEVLVEDPNSQPIENVEIAFSPNQKWYDGGGNQLLGAGYDTLEFLKRKAAGQPMPTYRDLASQTTFKTTATTDKKGKAVVRNLPAGAVWYEFEGLERAVQPYHWFSAKHKDYVLTPAALQPIRVSGLDVASVEVTAGGVAKIVVQMESKSDAAR